MTYLILGFQFQGPKKSAEGNRLGYIQWFEWLDVVLLLPLVPQTMALGSHMFTHYDNKWLWSGPETDFSSNALGHPEVPRSLKSQAPSDANFCTFFTPAGLPCFVRVNPVKVVLKYRRVIDQPLDKVPQFDVKWAQVSGTRMEGKAENWQAWNWLNAYVE